MKNNDFKEENLTKSVNFSENYDILSDGGFRLGINSSSLLNLTTLLAANYSYNDRYKRGQSGVGEEEDSYESSSGLDMANKNNNNNPGSQDLPKELTIISDGSKQLLIAYCVLFVIATSGNITVLHSVYKQYKKTKSRISLLILHLSVADLIVCWTLIPTEVIWRITIQWRGGNVLCKVVQFLRAFGLYLSSMVLICVSLDRFFSILFPLKMFKRRANKRIKLMLWIAWIASVAFSTPQAFLFSIASHPDFPSFKQCVTNEFLRNTEDVRMYSIFSVSAMYFAPLTVIIFTYTSILIKIIGKAHQSNQFVHHTDVEQQQQQQQQHQRSSTRYRRSISILMSAIKKGHRQSVDSSDSASTSSVRTGGRKQQYESRSQPMSTGESQKPRNSIISDQGDYFSEGSSSSFSTMTCAATNIPSTNNSGVNGAINASLRSAANPFRSQEAQIASSSSQSAQMVVLHKTKSRHHNHVVLRRSGNAAGQMSRAKNRTLLMTIVIVVAFVFCWTPYVVMTLWYMFDWDGAMEVDSRIQDGFFVMAVANSCVNPLIYGSFAKSFCGMSNILGRLRKMCGH